MMPYRCFGRYSALVLAVAGTMAVSTVQAAPCAKPPEMAALSVSELQSDLLVAALNCDAQARYNAFVEKFRPELDKANRTVGAWFRSAYGKGAQSRVDKFKTSAANDASARNLAAPRGYCTEASTLFDTLDTTTPDKLAEIATRQPFADAHGIAACKKPGEGKKTVKTGEKKKKEKEKGKKNGGAKTEPGKS
ncbi:MAG: hypothetical protein ABT940_09150 [Alphaproteobacteria bacterium]